MRDIREVGVAGGLVRAGGYPALGADGQTPRIRAIRPTSEVSHSPEHPVIVSTATQIKQHFFELVGYLTQENILPLGPYREEGVIFLQTGTYVRERTGETGAEMTVIDTKGTDPAKIIKTGSVHVTEGGKWNFDDITLIPAGDMHVITYSPALMGKLYRLLTINAIKANDSNDKETLARIRKAQDAKEDNEMRLGKTLANAMVWLVPPSVES